MARSTDQSIQMPNDSSLLSLRDVADELEVSPRTVRRWVREGKLQASMISGRYGPQYVVSPEAVDRMIQNGAHDPGTPHSALKHSSKNLYGREREIEQVVDVIDSLPGGAGATLLLTGPAGIGKTALLTAAHEECAVRGVRVFAGSARDLEHPSPFGLVSDALATFREHEAFPLGTAFKQSSEPPSEFGSPAELAATLRDFVRQVLCQEPTALLFEDLHWADEHSLAVIDLLASDLHHLPLLIGATFRDDEAETVAQTALLSLARKSATTQIQLHPWQQPTLQEYVRDAYGDIERETALRLTRYVFERAEGNPLFCLELLRSLEADGHLKVGGDRTTFDEPPHAEIPALVEEIISRRLGRLEPRTRRALEIAAVIGDPISYDVWVEAAHEDDQMIAQAAFDAAEREVLTEHHDDQSFSFSHGMVRQVLYREIPIPGRRAIHHRVGEIIAAQAMPDPDTVGQHFRQAGDARAIWWLILAADRAELRYAWEAAVERLEAALAVMDRHGEPHDPRRGWILYRLGRLKRYRDRAASLEHYKEAARHAQLTNDGLLAAYASIDHGLIRCYRGEVQAGSEQLLGAISALEALPDTSEPWTVVPPDWEWYRVPSSVPPSIPERWARTGLGLLWTMNSGRYRDVLDQADDFILAGERRVESIDITRRPPDEYYDGVMGLGSALYLGGRPGEACSALRKARTGYLNSGHHALAVNTAGSELEVHFVYHTRDLDERDRLASEIRNLAQRARGVGPQMEIAAKLGSPLFALFEGHWELLAEFLDRNRWPVTSALRARFAYLQGRFDDAWSTIHDFLPDGPDKPPGPSHGVITLAVMFTAAQVALEQGDLRSARRWLSAQLRQIEWSGAERWRAVYETERARFHLLEGDLLRARAHSEASLQSAAEPDQPLALIDAHRLRSRIELEAGDTDSAEHHAVHSLELARECRLPIEEALSAVMLANVKLHTRPDQALKLLIKAREVAVPIGAGLVLSEAKRVEQTIAARGASLTAAELTPREVEVLELMAEGRTNPEIGKQLFISPRTVDQHVSSIFNKLNVSSRTAAVRVAVAERLLEQ